MNYPSLNVRRAFALAVIASVIGTGCSRPAPTQTSVDRANPPVPAPQASSEPGAKPELPDVNAGPVPEPAPSIAKTPPTTKPSPSDPRIRPQKRFEIAQAGKDGWSTADLTAEQLGAKVDLANQSLSGVEAKVTMAIQNAEVKGQNSSEVKIVDRTHYEIGYQLPSNPTDTRMLVGKGQTQMALIGQKWSPSKASPVSQEALIKKWPDEFPDRVFGGFVHGTPVWKPLIAGLDKGVGGYKTVVEKRMLPVGGREVPFYRVLATRAGETMEMRFEGTRFVPLVVKVNRKDAKGRDANVQWQAGWTFGKAPDK